MKQLTSPSCYRYAGLAAITAGGVYSMFMARPEKVASAGHKEDPSAVENHQQPNRTR